MATSKYFNGRRVTLPGVYTTIKSGVLNPPQVTDYGKVLVLDLGLGANYGGGSGITGDLANSQDSIYQFTDLVTYREFLKGGLLWKVAEGLFKPDGAEVGASIVYHVKAATTSKSTLTFTATGGGAAGGTITFNPKDEGIIGNGLLDTNDDLYKGYAYTVVTGVKDTSKWILKVWRGGYKGVHTDGIAYDGVSQADSTPVLLAQSPEFNNIQTLIDWMNEDPSFGEYFVKATGTVTGLGTVIQADVTAVAGYNVATGGTESYDSDDLSNVLTAIKDLDYTHILCTKYGKDDYDNALVGAIVSHIETEAKYDKYMLYGGGKDKTEFTQTDGSIAQATYFDTNKVLVVHGDSKEASNLVASGFRVWPTIYKAAKVLGRIAGLPPQVPVTFKSINVDGEVHSLTDTEKEQALDGGVLATYYDADFRKFIVLKGVNTIQNNTNVINPDGKSFNHQIERIKAQLNKDLYVNAKSQLLGQPNGVNRNTLSPAYIRNWVIGFLESKRATSTKDDILLSYQDITVTRTQDYYEVNYGFTPNGEIDKVFFTGFLLD
jgi:hypothetical protein